MAATTWRRSSWAQVKTTGFGFEQLELLRDPRVTAAVRGKQPDEQIAEYLVDDVEQLITACDDRVLEAILLSSPGLASRMPPLDELDVRRDGLTSRNRSQLLTVAMYLQRLCSKNEATSFFGPVHWARIDPSGPTVIEPSTEEPRRGVFFAHWAAQTVADRIAEDERVAEHLVPELPANLVVRDGAAFRMDVVQSPTRVVELPWPADLQWARWYLLCDGIRTARQIAETAGTPVPETCAGLRGLAEAGLLRFGLEIPMGVVEPLDALAELLDRLPAEATDRWRPVLAALAGRREDFRQARGLAARRDAIQAMQDSFRELSGQQAERNGGQVAADRTVLIEDCCAGWPRFDLGGPLAGYLDDELPRVLDLFYELPLARRRARLALLQDWFDTRWQPDRPVPLDRVLAAAEAEDDALAGRLREVDDDLRQNGPSAITDVLWAHWDRPSVELELAWADQHTAGLPFDAWSVSGVDLLVAADSVPAMESGRFLGVIGEIHALHDQLLQGMFPHLHPDPEQLNREIGGLIRSVTPHTMCEPTLPHRRKQLARTDALPEIEFEQRSRHPAQRRIRSADLQVVSRDGSLLLIGEPFGSVALSRPPMWWWDAEIESVFSAFSGARIANMVDTTRTNPKYDHLPRLTVGRTVLSRETWWYPAPERKRHYRGLVPVNQRDAFRIKDELGLPDQVFVRFAEEPKPVLLDFDMPILVDIFVRLLARTSEPVEIIEMLPGPGQLWLQDHRGRHSCELRIGYYRAADGPAPR